MDSQRGGGWRRTSIWRSVERAHKLGSVDLETRNLAVVRLLDYPKAGQVCVFCAGFPMQPAGSVVVHVILRGDTASAGE